MSTQQGSLTKIQSQIRWWESKTQDTIRGQFNIDLLLKVIEGKNDYRTGPKKQNQTVRTVI